MLTAHEADKITRQARLFANIAHHDKIFAVEAVRQLTDAMEEAIRDGAEDGYGKLVWSIIDTAEVLYDGITRRWGEDELVAITRYAFLEFDDNYYVCTEGDEFGTYVIQWSSEDMMDELFKDDDEELFDDEEESDF